MVTQLGIAITNLTSKVGILSRKACKRLSIETGKKLVDRSREVGRLLNKEEVESVFTQTLPKKCRPKIITTKNEVADILRRQGLSEIQIFEQINIPGLGAATIMNERKKCPIWIPFENIESSENIQPFANSLIAHELEHALEKNHRVFDIFRRKISGVKKFFGEMFDKKFMQKTHEREMGIHMYEQSVHNAISGTLDPKTRLLACEPTAEAMDKYLKSKGKKGLFEYLREIMRNNYAGATNGGTEPNKRLKLMKYWMDVEHPAYEVMGEIDRYNFNLKDGEYLGHTAVAKSYDAAYKVAKQERKTYWKNKLLGKLKKPNVYVDDKDIFKYAKTAEEKTLLLNLLDNIDSSNQRILSRAKTEEEIYRASKEVSMRSKALKNSLIKFLYEHDNEPNSINTLSEFLEKVQEGNNNVYLDYLNCLRNYSLEFLNNPEIIEIAKLANANPENFGAINTILYLFSQLSDSKQITSWSKKIKEIVENNIDVEKNLHILTDEIEKSFPRA